MRSLADPAGYSQAVGVGHAGVEQHQQVGLAEIGGVPEGRPMATRPSPTAVGSICQSRSHCSRMWRLVGLSSTHEDPEAPEQDRRPGGPGRSSMGCSWSQTLAPVMAKVLPRPGFFPRYQSSPPIRATRFAAIVETQPGATVLPRGRGIFLLKRAKDPLLLVTGDADAGIAHI